MKEFYEWDLEDKIDFIRGGLGILLFTWFAIYGEINTGMAFSTESLTSFIVHLGGLR